MVETMLTEKAQALADELAASEQRPVADIVERALEAYKQRSAAPPRESAADFYARLRENAVDIDLEAIIKEGRRERHRPEIDF